jgi:hypothetical protein
MERTPRSKSECTAETYPTSHADATKNGNRRRVADVRYSDDIT